MPPLARLPTVRIARGLGSGNGSSKKAFLRPASVTQSGLSGGGMGMSGASHEKVHVRLPAALAGGMS